MIAPAILLISKRLRKLPRGRNGLYMFIDFPKRKKKIFLKILKQEIHHIAGVCGRMSLPHLSSQSQFLMDLK